MNRSRFETGSELRDGVSRLKGYLVPIVRFETPEAPSKRRLNRQLSLFYFRHIRSYWLASLCPYKHAHDLIFFFNIYN